MSGPCSSTGELAGRPLGVPICLLQEDSSPGYSASCSKGTPPGVNSIMVLQVIEKKLNLEEGSHFRRGPRRCLWKPLSLGLSIPASPHPSQLGALFHLYII